jgi:hypothetical protein
MLIEYIAGSYQSDGSTSTTAAGGSVEGLSRYINPASPVNWTHPLNSNRIGWWKYVDNPGWAGGKTLRDLTGLRHGTLTNGPTWKGANGRVGGRRSISFDGLDDYIDISSSLFTKLYYASNSHNIVSVAVWFKPTGNLTSYQALFDAGGASSERQLSVFLGGAANHIYIAIAAHSGTEITLSKSFVVNQWHRLLVTSDGNFIRVYLNGQLVGSNNSGIGPGFASAVGNWLVAANPTGGGAKFQGEQDDISVWARCLTDAEAAEDYKESVTDNRKTLNYLPSSYFTTYQGVSGTTAVGKESQLLWNIREAIGKTNQLIWNTYAAVGKAEQLIWNVRQAVGKSEQLLWEVFAAIGKANQLIWNVRKAVGKEESLLWNTLTTAGKSEQLLWKVRQAVGKSDQFLWNVREAVGKNSQLKWNVLQAVGDTAQLVWNVRSATGKSLDLIWNVAGVLTSVGKNAQLLWNIRQAVGKNESLLWNDYVTVGDNFSLLWKVRQLATGDAHLLWNVLHTVGKSEGLIWNVNEKVGDAISLAWNTRAAVAKIADLIWNVRAAAGKSAILTWNDYEKIGKAVDLLWKLRAQTGKELILVWNVEEIQISFDIYDFDLYITQLHEQDLIVTEESDKELIITEEEDETLWL